MTFGKLLTLLFRFNMNQCFTVNEIVLFQSLCNSLQALGTYSSVIHSLARSRTVFDIEKSFYDDYNTCTRKLPPIPTGFARRARELADLLIVVYSPDQNKARFTFLQAKYNQGSTFSHPFYGDMLQWCILNKDYYTHNRVNIIKSKIPWVDSALFQASILPSIGSFGVFYIDQQNNYEMGYFRTTELDACNPLPPYDHRSVKRLLDVCNQNNQNAIDGINPLYPDLLWCDNLQEFGNHLVNLEIGTPLDDTIKECILSSFPDVPQDFAQCHFYIEGQNEREAVGAQNDVFNERFIYPIPAVLIDVDAYFA